MPSWRRVLPLHGQIDAREDLPHLTTIMATGEVLRPEMRRTIERRLKVKGHQSLFGKRTWPHRVGGRRWQAAPQRGNPVCRGPPGAHDPKIPERLVVTPFYAFGTPLVRYAPETMSGFRMSPARTPSVCAGSMMSWPSAQFVSPSRWQPLPAGAFRRPRIAGDHRLSGMATRADQPDACRLEDRGSSSAQPATTRCLGKIPEGLPRQVMRRASSSSMPSRTT